MAKLGMKRIELGCWLLTTGDWSNVLVHQRSSFPQVGLRALEGLYGLQPTSDLSQPHIGMVEKPRRCNHEESPPLARS